MSKTIQVTTKKIRQDKYTYILEAYSTNKARVMAHQGVDSESALSEKEILERGKYWISSLPFIGDERDEFELNITALHERNYGVKVKSER